MTKRFFCLLLTLLPLAAFAHTGHGEHGFADGFWHPFLGVDHLLAMLLVGVWSVLNARKVWLAPAVFVALLTIGAVLGQNGIAVPMLEPLVATSVLVLGAMLALSFRPALPAALAVIGGFALVHGMAHGGELAAGSTIRPMRTSRNIASTASRPSWQMRRARVSSEPRSAAACGPATAST